MNVSILRFTLVSDAGSWIELHIAEGADKVQVFDSEGGYVEVSKEHGKRRALTLASACLVGQPKARLFDVSSRTIAGRYVVQAVSPELDVEGWYSRIGYAQANEAISAMSACARQGAGQCWRVLDLQANAVLATRGSF